MEHNPHEYKGLSAIIFTGIPLPPLFVWSQQTFWAEGTETLPYAHTQRESGEALSSAA